MAAPIVVHPPEPTGGRRVTGGDRRLGIARQPADVVEFIRRAGMHLDDIRLDDPELVEWRGGGPEVWE
ncbi:hypothetical protein ABTY53_15375 [Streptomyces noursei]|uniref:hypothetical protein n=1 Tax=Streptomyces noursei TaxID=1971 RepID=UPI00332334E8